MPPVEVGPLPRVCPFAADDRRGGHRGDAACLGFHAAVSAVSESPPGAVLLFFVCMWWIMG